MLFSEPKIPQRARSRRCVAAGCHFSALQRAENSSTLTTGTFTDLTLPFQCSSASRKFLNLLKSGGWLTRDGISVLFSEPKIPQPTAVLLLLVTRIEISVLFSEPKIPQRQSISAQTVR